VDHLKAQNAAVETFFKTLKAELIWRQSWNTRRETEAALFQYINGFYNPRRRHSALGWKSPLAFERKAAQLRLKVGTKA
jgi:putative transposase